MQIVPSNEAAERVQAKRPTHDVPAVARTITENWRKSVKAILRVAQECAKARDDLSKDEKKELYKLLPFKESMFSKLATIGDDPRLLEHQDRLPLSISTMYEARKLSDDRFDAAIKERMLAPDVKREDFSRWVKSKGKPVPSKLGQPELPTGLICLYVDAPPSSEQLTSMKTGAIELSERLGVKVAIFTGENIMAQLRRHWAKKPPRVD